MIDVLTMSALAQAWSDAAVAQSPIDPATGKTMISADTIAKQGTYLFALQYANLALAQEVSNQQVQIAANALPTTAKGQPFDDLIYAWFKQFRKPPGLATTYLTLARPAPQSGTYLAGTYAAGSVVQTPDGIQFGLVTDATFTSATASLSILAQAIVAGPTGNVSPNTITQLVTPCFDVTMTVNNTSATAGGDPAESEADCWNRLQSWWDTLSKGTLGAIEFVAMQVSGVSKATATEVPLPVIGPDTLVLAVATVLGSTVAETCRSALAAAVENLSGKVVTVSVTDANGMGNQALVDAVSAVMDSVRCAGIPVQVIAATIDWQTINVTFSYLAGTDTVACNARIKQAIMDIVNGLRVGEPFDPGAVVTMIRRDPGVDFRAAVTCDPPGAVDPLTFYDLIRTSADRITTNGV